MSLSWPAIFGSAAAVFAFSKLSPGGLQLQLFPSVMLVTSFLDFPCDSRCPPSHLSRCQDLKATHKSFEKPRCWLTPWQLYLKAISSYEVIFILHHHAPCQDPFFSQKGTVFLDSSFPPFLLPLDVKKSLPTSSAGQCSLLFCVTRPSEQAFPSDCSRCLINPVCRGGWGKTFFFLFMKHLPWNLLSLGENLGNIVFFFIQKSSQWAVGEF